MRIVLTGGGTGGHIYPALSIVEEMKRQNPEAEFLYIGAERGLEKDIVPKADVPFASISISGFRRKLLSLENIRTLLRFFRGINRTKKILRQFKPDVVVGTGGYVCGPVVYAASRLRIPTFIHEQNVIPGLTNQFLSRYVDTLAVSFKGSESNFPKAKRVIFSGNPRATTVSKADAAVGYETLGIKPGSKIVVVVGGSGGARAINDAMIEMISRIQQVDDTYFVYITGKAYFDPTMQRIHNDYTQLPDRLKVVPYIHNMPEVLAATTVIVNRAGASFLAEIMALGIPAILIPSPNVTNNHQEANARSLEKEGAAEMILERDLTGNDLFERIQRIVQDPIRREHMSKQSKKLGSPNASLLIVSEIKQLMGK